MYPVSTEFNDKMKETVRKVYGKVQIDYTDPFMDQSINMQSSENANISYPAQVADSIQEPIGKIFSLDGSCVLDGTYILAPVDSSKQMGWWGSQLAGIDGTFIEPYPTLTATFFSRPIHSLKAVGDSARGEYPVDFTIKLYNVDNILLYTETVIGNTQTEWSKTIDAITQVTKMVLEITKWSHANRQVKILEFFTSIQEVYEGDDILMVSLLEEREVSQGSLPVGNISSNEIDVRLYNRNRKFDAGNKQSPLYETLKANRRIKAWVGTENELVPLGTFWSGDWNVPEQGLYAQTTGRDRLELLRKSTYSKSEVEAGHSLEFDGVDDKIMLNNSAYLVLKTYTYEFKICLLEGYTGSFRKFLYRTGVVGDRQPAFYFWSSSNSLHFTWRNTKGTNESCNAMYIFPVGQWVSVSAMLEYDGIYTNSKIYVNGEFKASGITATEPAIEADVFEISGSSAHFKMSDLRVWNKTLTQQEIQANMYKKLTGTEEGLVAYYDFSEGTGTILHDKTTNANDGTIYGATWKNTGVSLAYLATKVLEDAGLKSDEYWIDTELQQYIIPYSYFTNQSHREALRKIAEACLGQVYCDREGIIRIEGPSYLENQTETAIEITQDDYFTKNNPVKWSEIANYIEVETQPLRPDIEQEVYRSNDPVSIEAGQTKTITAYYNHTPCIDTVASIEGIGTITDATYYAWGATVKISSDTTGTFTLVINAKPLKILNKEKAMAQDEASIVDNGKLRYVFPQNPLVQTKEIAQTIADKLLQYYKNPRRDIEIDWRGNPALLLGDRVSVTDKNEISSYNVVKQEIEFDGGLKAKISGRKVT